MRRWLRRAGSHLRGGLGAGLLTAALGAATGNSHATTLGLQMAAGGAVKKVSKAAGREIHRIGSPLASLAVLAGARALGADVPVELAGAAGADPTAIQHAVEFVVNGLLPGSLQTTTKHATRAVQDFAKRRAW